MKSTEQLTVRYGARAAFACNHDDGQMWREIATAADVPRDQIAVTHERRVTVTAPPSVIAIVLRDLQSAGERTLDARDVRACTTAEQRVQDQIIAQGFAVRYERIGRSLAYRPVIVRADAAAQP